MSEQHEGGAVAPSLGEALGCLSRCLSQLGDPFGDERDDVRGARTFISGPMSARPEFNVMAFQDAAAALSALGYLVENPSGSPTFRLALMQMLLCSGIALLPGWEGSDGARLEEEVGRRLGLTVAPIAEWLA